MTDDRRCLDDGELHAVNAMSLVVWGISALNIVVLFWIRVWLPRPPNRKAGGSPQYGVGGAFIVTVFATLALILYAPSTILSTLLIATGWAPDVGCNLKPGFPVFLIMTESIVVQLVLWSYVRLRTRHKVVEDLPLDGLPPRCRVLSVCAYRGLFAAPLAHRVAPLDGTVVGVDMYGTRFCDAPRAWAEENMAREGEVCAARTEFLSASTLASLPLQTGSVDFALFLLPAYAPWTSDSSVSSDEQRARLHASLLAIRRVLRPGGRLAVVYFGDEKTRDALAATGFTGSEAMPRKYWFSFRPFRGLVLTSPGPPSREEMARLAGEHAAAVATAPGADAPTTVARSVSSGLLLGEPTDAWGDAGAGSLGTGSLEAEGAYVPFGGEGLEEPSTHTPLRCALLLVALGVFAALQWAVIACWVSIDVPRTVSWSSRVGSEIASLVASLPGTFLLIHQQLHAYCRPWERGLPRRAVPPSHALWYWLRLVAMALVVYSAYGFAFWLPSFLFGWLLSTRTSLSDSTIETLGFFFGLLIIGLSVCASSACRRARAAKQHRPTENPHPL